MTSIRTGRQVHDKARRGSQVSRRAGLVAYGLLHVLVAWVAVDLALGHSQPDASGQGAMRQLASDPLGDALVWVIAVAMAVFALGRLVQGWVAHRDRGDGDENERKRWLHRVRDWGKAVVYAAISVSALGIASGSGGGGSSSERSLSARAMDLPAGGFVVAAVGVGIVVAGLWQCRRGLTRKFRDELSDGGKQGDAGTVYLAFGQVGHTAKGAVIALVGVLVGYAGATHEPQKSGGLDAALQTLRDQPFGPVLLCAVAAGIACYGLFCFAQARHLGR